MTDPNQEDPLSSEERDRSDFVRNLVQYRDFQSVVPEPQLAQIPKRIVQFWDDPQRLPEDVMKCMESWQRLEEAGFDLQVFDHAAAREYIRINLGSRYAKAFDLCYHPSMQSDYFRYSYIFVEGGFYIDADDIYHGQPLNHLFADGRLKLQPFCYDISTAKMIPPSDFLRPGANQPGWIFYFNTTPLIAGRNHPIVERALYNATISLEQGANGGLPEVQATTGPGNLTRSVFELIANEDCPKETLLVAHDWESISTSKWPLSYRNDARNWRLSNQHAYQRLLDTND